MLIMTYIGGENYKTTKNATQKYCCVKTLYKSVHHVRHYTQTNYTFYSRRYKIITIVFLYSDKQVYTRSIQSLISANKPTVVVFCLNQGSWSLRQADSYAHSKKCIVPYAPSIFLSVFFSMLDITTLNKTHLQKIIMQHSQRVMDLRGKLPLLEHTELK